MADFCKQCSLEYFGEDFKELANLGRGRELSEGCGWTAVCEGCGFIVVNNEGECVDKGCKLHGQTEVKE